MLRNLELVRANERNDRVSQKRSHTASGLNAHPVLSTASKWPIFLLQEALGTSDLVETILKENGKTKPLLPQQLMRHREIQLPSGEYYFPSDRLLIISLVPLSWVPEV